MADIKQSALELIGNTPILQLNRYSRCMLLRMADGLHYNCSTHCIRIPYIH